MTAYYNENDSFAAAWLRELIHDGLIAPGEVDTRSIKDVAGGDLSGFTQVHLFAGIGGWSYALRLADWPDDRAVWTGSCPCQPFSAAGKQAGTADERHLWPEMHRLIAECAPAVVFGEQVASALGRQWLAGVRTDLEALAYGVGCADLCAAGVGAPHIRQRLYWVADSVGEGQRWSDRPSSARLRDAVERCGSVDGVADAERDSRGTRRPSVEPAESARAPYAGASVEPGRRGDVGRMGDASSAGSGRNAGAVLSSQTSAEGRVRREPDELEYAGSGVADTVSAGRPERRTFAGNRPSPWSGVFIPCADGKARRVEPSVQPLAHGIPNRVGTLRGAGNSINPQTAEAFIRAFSAS